jgi:hypothetical protein
VRQYPPPPEGWEVEKRRHTGPFTTAVTYLHPDGRRIHWSSREHRKRSAHLAGGRRHEHPYWAPRRAWWWMAVLFALGSTCFLVGPFPGFVDLVGPRIDGVVFFVGSLLFTSAAFLQWRESVQTNHSSPLPTRHTGRSTLFAPRRIDWWASAVQLVGTLFFNVTTFHALSTAIDAPSYNSLVWRPDALGSICFLVAGGLAYAEVTGGLLHRPPSSLEGRIVAVNLAGCVLFGLSALGAYVLPATGDSVNVTIANVGTALGALGFLIGAVLLLPEGAGVTATAAPVTPGR